MIGNKYRIFLENLRRSGVTNMFGSASYVVDEFGVSHNEAVKIVSEWMKNYNPADYEEDE